MLKPKYFAKSLDDFARQVVPEQIYKQRGVKSLELMDQRILETLDDLRHNLGVPLTVNSWAWGGGRTQSGLRDQFFYKSVDEYLKSFSQHKAGRGIDIVCSLPAYEVRKHIIENRELYPHVSFMEVQIEWTHLDARTRIDEDWCKFWSPKEGFLSEEEVLSRKL